jgi:benzoate membrane transport protein
MTSALDKTPRFERPERPVAGPRCLRRDLTGTTLTNGVIGLVFSATGPIAVSLAVGMRGGLTAAQLASWIFGEFFLDGILTVLASWLHRRRWRSSGRFPARSSSADSWTT